MIDVYFWPTGNGKKVTIMLEESGLPYNKLLPTDTADKYRVLQWVNWRVGGLGAS